MLLALCCLVHAQMAEASITVASGVVEVKTRTLKLGRCGYETCTLVLRGARVRVGAEFFARVGRVSMGGTSVLEVPHTPHFPVTMEATDTIAVDPSLVDDPDDENNIPVCTYNGDDNAFTDERCACCVEKERTHLVLNVTRHTVNALTAGVWRSCDVVSSGNSPATVTASGMPFGVLGEMVVHGHASLHGDIGVGCLSVIPPTSTGDIGHDADTEGHWEQETNTQRETRE